MQVVPNYLLWVYVPTGVGGIVLTYLLLSSRLVPRAIALLGLVGYVSLTIGVPLDLRGMLDMSSVPHASGRRHWPQARERGTMMPVDTNAECRVVRGGEYDGQQGLTYASGVSAESAGAQGLCLHTLTIPPGGRARAHRHSSHESAIYLVSGVVDVWWGEGLARHEVMEAGDFIYIPAGVPHLPANNGAEPAFGVVARTDPNEQESVELLPDLDALVAPDA